MHSKQSIRWGCIRCRSFKQRTSTHLHPLNTLPAQKKGFIGVHRWTAWTTFWLSKTDWNFEGSCPCGMCWGQLLKLQNSNWNLTHCFVRTLYSSTFCLDFAIYFDLKVITKAFIEVGDQNFNVCQHVQHCHELPGLHVLTERTWAEVESSLIHLTQSDHRIYTIWWSYIIYICKYLYT